MEVRAFSGPSLWGISSDDEDIQDEASALQEGNRPSVYEGKDIAGAASGLVELITLERRNSDHKRLQCAGPSENTGAIAASSRVSITFSRQINDYQKLQYANNYCKAAYLELMRLAKEAGTWVRMTPALGNLDDIVSEFRAPAPLGKTTEFSVATAVIPNISASDMATMMLTTKKWSKSLFPYVNYGEGCRPDFRLQHLRNCDPSIKRVIQVYAELQLPTAMVPRRYFDFLRYGKVIMDDVYVIVDISSRPFDPFIEFNSEKRPSGVIIREHGPQDCEIICVENVEVDTETTQNMHSSVFYSNLQFSAKRWISTLLSNLRREKSTFIDVKMNVHRNAGSYLLAITRSVKDFFMECVSQHPDEAVVSVLTGTEDPIRLLRVKSVKECSAYVGVSSFRIQAKPLSVFQFLKKRDIQLQFGCSGNPEQLFQFVTDDKSNIISLHRMEMEEGTRYCLEEASSDEYCSFIISGIVSEEDVNFHIVSGVESNYEQNERPCNTTTSGFSIMPDGPGGLQCNGSFVTIAMQLHYDPTESPEMLDRVRDDFLIDWNAIIKELNEEV